MPTSSREPLSLDQAADVFDYGVLRRIITTVGDTLLREAVRRGDVPHVRIGRRQLFHRETIRAWLAGEQGQPAVAPTALPLRNARRVAR